MRFDLRLGDALLVLRDMADESVQCVVTSPPYWGLRDYGVPGQLGLERTPAEYVENLVAIFGEVRRVLRSDGTLWLNLGDCYAASGRGGDTGKSGLQGTTDSQDESKRARAGQRIGHRSSFRRDRAPRMDVPHKSGPALKPKDLVGIPWRVAFALQADGWWLRSDIIWAKPNPMPESVTDRPTKAHEYLFLLAKSERYFFDQDAAREPYLYGRDHFRNADIPPESHVPASPKHTGLRRAGNAARSYEGRLHHKAGGIPWKEEAGGGRNMRSVWTLSTQPFPGAHFATFPEALAERCIRAGTGGGHLVLDPFCGSGTVGVVAVGLQRSFVGIELNPEYAEMARRRIGQVAPMFAEAVPA